MEKLLANELLKYILILGAGAVAVTVVMTRLIARIKGSFKPYQKSTIIYLLVFVICFAAISLTAIPGLFDKVPTLFIFLQVYFLLLGGFHVFFLNKKLAWVDDKKSMIPELLFSMIICLFGCMLFLVIYHALNKNGFEYLLAWSILFFIIPFFFYHTFQHSVAIPPKIFKQWFYPVAEEIEEPEDSKMKNLVVISFEFQKQTGENRLTNFRAKAPRDMEFGMLFYYFINDYNLMNTNSKIHYANQAGEPDGWIFYKKPKWFSVITKYIDADKTILSNQIKENDVIICTRAQT